MLLRYLEGLIDAFSNGNAGHDHDKLAPTIVLVQLIHGLDVGVGFTDTGLHLNGQVITAFQPLRGFDLVGPLYFLQML